MGFKQRTFSYDYDDETLWPGLHVLMRPANVGESLVLDRIVEAARDGISDAFGNDELREDMVSLITACILDWNLETDDDIEVPITEDAVGRLEISLFLNLFMRWVADVRGVRRPLPSSSPAGEPSPEGSTSPDESRRVPTADELGIDVEMETSAGTVTA